MLRRILTLIFLLSSFSNSKKILIILPHSFKPLKIPLTVVSNHIKSNNNSTDFLNLEFLIQHKDGKYYTEDAESNSYSSEVSGNDLLSAIEKKLQVFNYVAKFQEIESIYGQNLTKEEIINQAYDQNYEEQVPYYALIGGASSDDAKSIIPLLKMPFRTGRRFLFISPTASDPELSGKIKILDLDEKNDDEDKKENHDKMSII